MDNYGDDFWRSSERSIQDDFSFLSLSSNENRQNNNQQNNNNVSVAGAGDAPDGGSMEIDHLQGFIHNNQNDPQLQAAYPQSGAMDYGDQYPEFGSPMLHQESMPLTAFHQNDHQYGINQDQGESPNMINFLDRDMPPQGQRLNEGMPFINLAGSINGGVSQSVGVTSSFQSPQAYNQVQLSNPMNMPMNTQNDGIGSSSTIYSLVLDRTIDMGGRAHGRRMIGDSQTWEDPELKNLLMLGAVANSPQNKRPIPNSVYDPRYEQMGLPIDPHLRLFLAEKAHWSWASTSNNNKW